MILKMSSADEIMIRLPRKSNAEKGTGQCKTSMGRINELQIDIKMRASLPLISRTDTTAQATMTRAGNRQCKVWPKDKLAEGAA